MIFISKKTWESTIQPIRLTQLEEERQLAD